MNAIDSKIARFVERPILGPVMFGLVFGGIPNGVVLSSFFDAITTNFEPSMLLLSMLAIPVTAVGARLGVRGDWKDVLRKAFFTSFASCVPIPTIIYTFKIWRLGFEVFDLRNFPFFITFLVFWSVAVAIVGWLVALQFSQRQNRRLHP